METFVKQQVVKGVSFFDGEIDGKSVKSGSVFIESQMDEKSGTAKGFRTVEYKTNIDVVKPIIHLEFPINAEVHYAMKVTKGNNTMVIEQIKPLGRAPAMPKAA